MKKIVLIIVTILFIAMSCNSQILPKTNIVSTNTLMTVNKSGQNFSLTVNGSDGSSTLSNVLQNGNEIFNNQIIYRKLSDTIASIDCNFNGVTLGYINQTNELNSYVSLFNNYLDLGSSSPSNNSELVINSDSINITSPKLNYNGYEILTDNNLKGLGLTTVTSTTNEVVVGNVFVNANTIKSGDAIYFTSSAIKTNTTVTLAFKLYINDTPDLLGSPVQLAYYISTAPIKFIPIQRNFYFNGSNLIGFLQTQSSIADYYSNAILDVPINFALNKYFIVTIKTSSSVPEPASLNYMNFVINQ